MSLVFAYSYLFPNSLFIRVLKSWFFACKAIRFFEILLMILSTFASEFFPSRADNFVLSFQSCSRNGLISF